MTIYRSSSILHVYNISYILHTVLSAAFKFNLRLSGCFTIYIIIRNKLTMQKLIRDLSHLSERKFNACEKNLYIFDVRSIIFCTWYYILCYNIHISGWSDCAQKYLYVSSEVINNAVLHRVPNLLLMEVQWAVEYLRILFKMHQHFITRVFLYCQYKLIHEPMNNNVIGKTENIYLFQWFFFVL